MRNSLSVEAGNKHTCHVIFCHIPSVHLCGIKAACRSSERQNRNKTGVNGLQLMTETAEYTLQFCGHSSSNLLLENDENVL